MKNCYDWLKQQLDLHASRPAALTTIDIEGPSSSYSAVAPWAALSSTHCITAEMEWNGQVGLETSSILVTCKVKNI